MSKGLTPAEFVKQVYYAQEKVLLDFEPDDDKYQEVLYEANLVLQELQNAEDWSWLRRQINLGRLIYNPGHIPEFELPDWVYKPSMLHGDGLKLYPCIHGKPDKEVRPIVVPYSTTGHNSDIRTVQVDRFGGIDTLDPLLRAICVGDIITFNRLPNFFESNLYAVADVQKRIDLIHTCNSSCKRDKSGKCIEAQKPILMEIPDPNYVVLQTAARHAEGSPPAQARIEGLVDAAQKILSAMRSNDAACTDPDYVEWDIPGHIELV